MTARLALGPLVLILLWAIGPIPSYADHFGSQDRAGNPPNGVWLTNSSSFTVAKVALTAGYSQGVDNSMTQEYRPTDFFERVIVYAFCSDAQMDTCVVDSAYGPNGLNGWNDCEGTITGSGTSKVCSLSTVRINQTYTPPAKRVACHEIGHSVGLRHTSADTSCMKRTADGGDSAVLDGHDDDEINDHY